MRSWIVSTTDADRFEEVEVERPAPTGHDLLVQVHAVATNPVDTKVRRSRAGQVLGWDASGVVAAVGDEVQGFSVGDAVYYAGDLTRAGCNTQYHLVDERLVARKPARLDHLQTAALPLTALTAWEGLYEQLRMRGGRSLLVINGAGGVGSMVIQLAKQLSGATVIATASRPESAAWVRELGADHVVDHRESLPEQLAALGSKTVDHVFCCHDIEKHFDAMAESIAPQGGIVAIVNSDAPLPMHKLFSKKVSFSWELMFTKAMYKTADMASQRTILERVAQLIDEGVLRGTLREDAGQLTAESLTRAHQQQASASLIGKLALRVPQG